MKCFFLSLLLILFYYESYSQNTQIEQYTSIRNTVSIAFLQNSFFSGEFKQKLNDEIVINDKLFYNKISDNILDTYNNINSINQIIEEKSLSSKILDSWCNIDTIISRAKYSLSNIDYSMLQKTARGIETIKDERWFRDLISNTYLIVISVDQVYNQDVKNRKKQSFNNVLSIAQGNLDGAYIKNSGYGYDGKITAILYKINLDDNNFNTFWEYFNNKTVQNNKTPLEYICQVSSKVKDCHNDSKDELYLKTHFINSAIEAAISKLNNKYIPFAIKSPIIDNRPLSSNIGTKEGLRHDDLFKVYELTHLKNGSLKYKNKGVVRVKKIADNKYSFNNPSVFYRVQYGKYQQGMVLVEKREVGFFINVGLIIGNNSKSIDAYKLRFGQNISKLLNLKNPRHINLYGEIMFSNQFIDNSAVFKDFAIEKNDNKYINAKKLLTYSLGIGLEKQFYILPGFQIAPFAGVTVERSYYSNKRLINDMLSGYKLPNNYGDILYFNFGLRTSLNILYNLKLASSFIFTTRNYKKSEGVGSAPQFVKYPSNIVSNEKYFWEITLNYEF